MFWLFDRKLWWKTIKTPGCIYATSIVAILLILHFFVFNP